MVRSLLLIAILQAVSLSQPTLLWSEEYYAGEESFFKEVIQATTGEYYVAGWAPTSCLCKVSQTGELLWSYGLDEMDTEWAYWVDELTDGAIAVTGLCKNDPDEYYSMMVAKVLQDGSEVWARVYDLDPDRTECGYSLTELPCGDMIVCGFADAFGIPCIGEAYIMRIDPEGNVIWDASWGNSSFTNYALRATFSDGIVYVLTHGSHNSPGGPFILWYSDEGEYLGHRRIDVLASYYTGHGHPNEDSGFTFTANNGYTGDPPTYTTLARVDSLGRVIWLKHVVEDNLTMGISVTRMANGNYLYGGSETIAVGTEVPPWMGDRIGVIYSFDPDGDELWRVPVSSNGCERIDGVIETYSGGIIACGGGYPESWLYCFGDATGIEIDPDIQQQTVLNSFPNPFTSSVSITCILPCQMNNTELSVYNLSGRLVRSLYSGNLDDGDHSFEWTPERNIPSGCYLIRLQVGDEVRTETCVYLR